MKFWPSKRAEEKPVEVKFTVTAPAGTIISCDNPKDIVVVPEKKPKNPEPDLATKPKDIVSYCFGFACPKKHVQDLFESITPDRYSERRACSVCGGVSKPCVAKRVAVAMWVQSFDAWGSSSSPRFWYWRQNWHNGGTFWTSQKFFHYLENPRRKK